MTVKAPPGGETREEGERPDCGQQRAERAAAAPTRKGSQALRACGPKLLVEQPLENHFASFGWWLEERKPRRTQRGLRRLR